MELISENNYGPMARYTDAHIFLVLDIIQRKGRVSRKGLVEETGLGEGSIRGMLKVLKEWRWVDVRQTGIHITEFGKRSFDSFRIRYVDVYNKKYAVSGFQQGIIVEDAADKVTNGMAQRDLAVRNGADGAVIFVMREGRIILPESWVIDVEDPAFAEEIRAAGIKDGDALVIVDSKDPSVAKVVAAAVGLAMR